MNDVYTVFRSMADNLTSQEIIDFLRLTESIQSFNELCDLLAEEVEYDAEMEVPL